MGSRERCRPADPVCLSTSTVSWCGARLVAHAAESWAPACKAACLQSATAVSGQLAEARMAAADASRRLRAMAGPAQVVVLR